MRRHEPHGRPHWWPEGEPFPPDGPPWRAMRRHFMRRVAIAFFAFALLFAGGLTFVFWVVARLVGVASPGGPFWSDRLGPQIGFLVLLLVVGALAVGGVVRRVASRAGNLIEAAGRVEAGDYAVRVPERGPREVRSLARAFNAMTSRLERNETLRRDLLADVTHELRTPLTVVQGQLEGIIDGLYPADAAHLAPILEEMKVLARLIEDLRTLSRAEAGALALHREPSDVAALARDVLAAQADVARRAGIELRATGADACVADADPIRVREILANLVGNALRYTPAGGSIEIAVRRRNGSVEVVVRDTGTGVAHDALPHIFERFSRSTESPGAGLGLAIARSLVLAHGGEIRAESAAGEGTRIAFTLPCG